MTVYLSSHRLFAALGVLLLADIAAANVEDGLRIAPLFLSFLGLIWQPTLLAVVLVTIRKFRLTMLCTVLASMLLLWSLKAQVLSPAGDEAAAIFTAYVMTLAFVIAGLAMRSIRYFRFDTAFVQRDEALAPPRQGQFDLRDLFGAATVAAVALTIARHVSWPRLTLSTVTYLGSDGSSLMLLVVWLGTLVATVPWLWLPLGWNGDDHPWVLRVSMGSTIALILLGGLGCGVVALTIVMVSLQLPVLAALWKYNYDERTGQKVSGYGAQRRSILIASRNATANASTSDRVL